MTSNHRALDGADIALIEHVKQTPSLYDSRNPDFRLAYRKEQDWISVSDSLGLSPNDARRRWTCLRDRYSRELKQLRLHPEKGDYGKNNFFILMDFLRGFVRKRRHRRRNSGFKYENNWDSTMDGTKLVNKIKKSEDDEEDGIEDDQQDNYENTTTKPVFQDEIEMQAADADNYSVYVEDTCGTYEDYTEPQQSAETENTNTGSSGSNSTIIPVMIRQTGSVTSASYELSTQQKNTNTEIQHHRQQANPQQHEQSTTLILPITTTQLHKQMQYNANESTAVTETEDDFFCKSIAAYLRQLSRRHKIKAKVEMFQILEKYIELEESPDMTSNVARK